MFILQGAHVFFAHLTDHLKKLKNSKGLNIPLSFEFIKVKSYENEHSVGDVKISMSHEDLKEFEGKDILICEDIVDTGNDPQLHITIIQFRKHNGCVVEKIKRVQS